MEVVCRYVGMSYSFWGSSIESFYGILRCIFCGFYSGLYLL